MVFLHSERFPTLSNLPFIADKVEKAADSNRDCGKYDNSSPLYSQVSPTNQTKGYFYYPFLSLEN